MKNNMSRTLWALALSMYAFNGYGQLFTPGGVVGPTVLPPGSTFVGVGTNAPTAQFHTTQSVRHGGLLNNNALTRIIASDANGNLAWRDASTLIGSNSWALTGNAGTNPAINFLGTTDAQPVLVKTNNVQQMKINVLDAQGVGMVELGDGSNDNGSLSVFGRDITGYSMPFRIVNDVSSQIWDPTTGSNHTLGRMMRFDQQNSGTESYYDMGIDDQRSFFITQRATVGGVGGSPVFPKKMLIISENNQVGINLGATGTWAAMPTADFHTNGSVRHENLPTNTGDVLVIDNDGNVYNSRVPVSGLGVGGITSTCVTPDMIPKVMSPAGDLTCSQIYDDGTSVGIATTGPFAYTAGTGTSLGLPAPSGTVRLDVAGTLRADFIVATSDAKYKTGVVSLSGSLDKVMKMKGVEYSWNLEKFSDKGFDNLKHSGFLAQELVKVLPNSVIVDKDGDYAVDYNSIIPVLTEAIKEQQKEIEELRDLISVRSATGAGDGISVPVTGAVLYQNTPNPFSQQTEIRYKLPENFTDAAIMVFDMNGKQIRSIGLKGAGQGHITFSGSELSAGMYLYSLVLNGQEVDTKRMILTQ